MGYATGPESFEGGGLALAAIPGGEDVARSVIDKKFSLTVNWMSYMMSYKTSKARNL